MRSKGMMPHLDQIKTFRRFSRLLAFCHLVFDGEQNPKNSLSEGGLAVIFNDAGPDEAGRVSDETMQGSRYPGGRVPSGQRPRGCHPRHAAKPQSRTLSRTDFYQTHTS